MVQVHPRLHIMNIFSKIENFIYIYKWLLVKNWHYIVEDYYKGKKTGITTKVCKLTSGQIEGLLHVIYHLRKKKRYKLADYIRDKLVMVGDYWWLPDKINVGNYNGHYAGKLQFFAGKFCDRRWDMIGGRATDKGKTKDSVMLKGSIVARNEAYSGRFKYQHD